MRADWPNVKVPDGQWEKLLRCRCEPSRFVDLLRIVIDVGVEIADAGFGHGSPIAASELPPYRLFAERSGPL